MLAECFCKAMAWQDIRFVIDIMEVGGDWR
jgi:hypothetical protein